MNSAFYILTCLCLSLSNFGNDCWGLGQDGQDDKQRFVLVITLDSARIDSLMANRFLKTEVPPNLVNKIESIRFQNPTSFHDEPIAIKAKTDKRSRSLATKIDQSVLDRLGYQPVEMKIYDSNFSSVLVVLDQPKSDSVAAIPGQLELPPEAPNDSKPFFVRLTKTRGIYGSLKEMKTLSMKSDFGNIEVPFEQIKGIRFHQDAKAADATQVFVVMANNDNLSGTISNQSFVVKSRWGEKEILVKEIESLTPSPQIIFAVAPNSNSKWILAEQKTKLQRRSKN